MPWRKCGKGTCPDRELLPFIGPPLTESFQKICGMTAAEANTALEYYRERFARVGMYENSVYDGIPEITAKPAAGRQDRSHQQAAALRRKILEHFGLAAHFSAIAGPGFNGELPTKADVISEVLQRLHLTAADKNAAVMLGDREHDAIGAQQNKIAIIGAGYGYSSPGELSAAGVRQIVSAPAGFCRLFIMIYF